MFKNSFAHFWGGGGGPLKCYLGNNQWIPWDRISLICLLLGVRDKRPKSKYQNFKSTRWFSYKIWTKNCREPLVYLYNWPLPEQHNFLKIRWEINFLTFLILTETLQKIFLNENMDILISNLLSKSIFAFGKWSNWKYANTRIWVLLKFWYLDFGHLSLTLTSAEVPL